MGAKVRFAKSAGLFSVQEEVPDAGRLNPGDVGGGAGEDAGFVLHGAADGAKAHHAVYLPAIAAKLAQERTTRVALKGKQVMRDGEKP